MTCGMHFLSKTLSSLWQWNESVLRQNRKNVLLKIGKRKKKTNETKYLDIGWNDRDQIHKMYFNVIAKQCRRDKVVRQVTKTIIRF